jgi:hypothetical protein
LLFCDENPTVRTSPKKSMKSNAVADCPSKSTQTVSQSGSKASSKAATASFIKSSAAASSKSSVLSTATIPSSKPGLPENKVLTKSPAAPSEPKVAVRGNSSAHAEEEAKESSISAQFNPDSGGNMSDHLLELGRSLQSTRDYVTPLLMIAKRFPAAVIVCHRETIKQVAEVGFAGFLMYLLSPR